jgi:hypothetical protein
VFRISSPRWMLRGFISISSGSNITSGTTTFGKVIVSIIYNLPEGNATCYADTMTGGKEGDDGDHEAECRSLLTSG